MKENRAVRLVGADRFRVQIAVEHVHRFVVFFIASLEPAVPVEIDRECGSAR